MHWFLRLVIAVGVGGVVLVVLARLGLGAGGDERVVLALSGVVGLIATSITFIQITHRTGPAAVAARRKRGGGCVECGYDLSGNVSGVCPECGDAPVYAEAAERNVFLVCDRCYAKLGCSDDFSSNHPCGSDAYNVDHCRNLAAHARETGWYVVHKLDSRDLVILCPGCRDRRADFGAPPGL